MAVDGALARLRKPLPSRRASGFVGGLAMFLGVVLIAVALMTALWQDPFTAVFAQHEQKVLSKELDANQRAPLAAGTLAFVREAGTYEGRMAVLAGDLASRTRSGGPLGRIAIPRLHEKFVFVSGTGTESLKKGPGHYATTGLPGQRGTVGIAGHRTTYLAPFRHLDRMRRGDSITLTMGYGQFKYRVEGSRVVLPTSTGVLKHRGYRRLVLTTCTPLHSAAKRLVVTARLQHATPLGPAAKMTPLPPVAPLPDRPAPRGV
jgi:sortase A